MAEGLERWASEADVDGFNLAHILTSGTYVDFIDHAVPHLRRRARLPELPVPAAPRGAIPQASLTGDSSPLEQRTHCY
jgi:hypothetical protein